MPTEKFHLPIGGYIECLHRNNYSNWASMMQKLLLSKSLWGYVSRTRQRPTVITKDIEYWEGQDAEAYLLIFLLISPSIRPSIKTCTHSSDLWQYLRERFGNSEPKIPRRSATIQNKFLSAKQAPAEAVLSYFGRLNAMRKILDGTQEELSDAWLRAKLLTSLLPRFDEISRELQGSKKNLNQTLLELLDVECEFKQASSEDTTSSKRSREEDEDSEEDASPRKRSVSDDSSCGETEGDESLSTRSGDSEFSNKSKRVLRNFDILEKS